MLSALLLLSQLFSPSESDSSFDRNPPYLVATAVRPLQISHDQLRIQLRDWSTELLSPPASSYSTPRNPTKRRQEAVARTETEWVRWRKRDDGEGPTSPATSTFVALSTATGAVPSSAAEPIEAASALRRTGLAPAVPPSPLPLPAPFPQPFDLTLSLNFTPSCLSYFSFFLSTPTFLACRPLSLLMTSSSAFAALGTSNLTSLTAAIGGTLETAVNPATCQAFMDRTGGTFADWCKSDLAAGNAVATRAFNGFKSYGMIREAGALIASSTTKAYCYVDAIAQDKPDDLFYWQLASGASLPASVSPTCSDCSKMLMSVYSRYASNGSLPISSSYADAVTRSSSKCGSSFATAVDVKSSSSRHLVTSSLLALLPAFAIPILLL